MHIIYTKPFFFYEIILYTLSITARTFNYYYRGVAQCDIKICSHVLLLFKVRDKRHLQCIIVIWFSTNNLDDILVVIVHCEFSASFYKICKNS